MEKTDFYDYLLSFLKWIDKFRNKIMIAHSPIKDLPVQFSIIYGTLYIIIPYHKPHIIKITTEQKKIFNLYDQLKSENNLDLFLNQITQFTLENV